jgi:hypothetical protein
MEAASRRRRIMRTFLPIIAVAVASFGWNSAAEAQLTTERFIPVGQSPGVSGILTIIGEVTAMDEAARTITVRGEDETRTVRVSDSTRIWLDRSAQQLTSLVGDLADCQMGRRVEVKYVDIERKEAADWIKVVVPPPSPLPRPLPREEGGGRRISDF